VQIMVGECLQTVLCRIQSFIGLVNQEFSFMRFFNLLLEIS
jgi:hypothetical protein